MHYSRGQGDRPGPLFAPGAGPAPGWMMTQEEDDS
jgi:hypothetical protein